MYYKVIFSLIFLTFIMNVQADDAADEGLPLFWWKEGNFFNFGDHISHLMVERIVGSPVRYYNKKTPNQDKKLIAIGSALSFAYDEDVIWGSGVNGKCLDKKHYSFANLDIRAVRGPLTKQFLETHFHIEVPEIYGDPALLFPYLFPEFQRNENPKNDYLVILHYHDIPLMNKINGSRIISAIEPWYLIIKEILNSKFVISSSLHGVVIAEAYGIPARLLRLSEHEPLFKFRDYYLGTGREGFECASSIEEALVMQGEAPFKCDLEKLYNAFPFEFWPNGNFPTLEFQRELIE